MANPSITIPLDPETARAYNSAAPEEKRKIQALLSLWLRELAAGEYPSLEQVLDEIGGKAKARELTPEKLDSLLKLTGEECVPTIWARIATAALFWKAYGTPKDE
jgi:hypothetical protein